MVLVNKTDQMISDDLPESSRTVVRWQVLVTAMVVGLQLGVTAPMVEMHVMTRHGCSDAVPQLALKRIHQHSNIYIYIYTA